jgi:hypothetical protein
MNGKECAVVHLYFHLAEIACGDFSGHYFVARRQKAWFLSAAPEVGQRKSSPTGS